MQYEKEKRLLIDIYEGKGQKPVLGYVFYGTDDTIKATINAHIKSDRFFAAALRQQPFDGIELRVTWTWL